MYSFKILNSELIKSCKHFVWSRVLAESNQADLRLALPRVNAQELLEHLVDVEHKKVTLLQFYPQDSVVGHM